MVSFPPPVANGTARGYNMQVLEDYARGEKKRKVEYANECEDIICKAHSIILFFILFFHNSF